MVPALKSSIMNGFLDTGGNLQKAGAETESSMLEFQRHAVGINGHGREGSSRNGYWEKTNLEVTSRAGLVGLLGSSENGMTLFTVSKWRRGMWFFIMPSWKRRAASGKTHHPQQQRWASPQPSLTSPVCFRSGPVYRGVKALLIFCLREAHMWR